MSASRKPAERRKSHERADLAHNLAHGKKTRAPKRHTTEIGFSKILTPSDEQGLSDYMTGKRPGIDGRFFAKDTIKGKRAALMIDLLFNTGMRLSELCSLRIKDTPLVLSMDAIEVRHGKGDKDRTIPIGPKLSQKIKDYCKDVRPYTMPRYVRRKDTEGFLFYSSRKKPFLMKVRRKDDQGNYVMKRRGSTGAYRNIRNICNLAGIEKRISPHRFRHTYCVRSLSRENGFDPGTVQRIMGHSDLRITSRYFHLRDNEMFTRAAGLEKMLG